MTKKDYELIAKVIRGIYTESVTNMDYSDLKLHCNKCHRCLQDIASSFANELELVNRRFNRDKFMDACGFSGLGMG